MHPYIPHTEADVKQMLDSIGVKSIDDLFADIPKEVRLKKELSIPTGISEYEALIAMTKISDKNQIPYLSFLGAGSYDHIIPSIVSHIIGRSEFYTSYTPYQAEISQGTLQSIFEFQTMISHLTNMEVSNASVYDAHTAASEAAVMAINTVRKSNVVLVAETAHPYTKHVLKTFFEDLEVKVVEIASKNGQTDLSDLKAKCSENTACFIGQNPNFFGVVEDFTGFADFLHEQKKVFIISSNPLSLGILKSQGEWGADIAIGDTQPCGISTYYGGPNVGYIAAKEALLRKMPGRIAGQTTDKEGKRAFVLTLQAREQHIKRERATSNICSNQALLALASTVYLSAIGKKGIVEVGKQNIAKAHYAAKKLAEEKLGKLYYDTPFYNEFAFTFNKDANAIISVLKNKYIFPGVSLEPICGSQYKNTLLIAVTEKKTKENIDLLVSEIKKV